MITYYQKTVTSKNLKQIPEYKIGSWVYIENPSEEEVMHLVGALGIEEGLLRDSLDPYEVPRVETEGKNAYIFTRYPFLEEGKVVTLPVLIGIAEGFVFTVVQRPFPFLEKFVEGKIEFNTTQKIRFLLQIFQEIDTTYASMITLVSKEIRRHQSNLGKEITNEDIVSFVGFENVLSDLLDALAPTKTTLENILSGKLLTLYEEDKEYTEDLVLETGQLLDRTRALLRTVQSIRSAYSTIMTNNLNRVIKFLTGMTIVVTVPSIVVNIFGMNVMLPFDSSHSQSFWAVLGFTVFMTIVAVWFFRKKGWV
jgi:magnesium transporter